MTPMHQIKTNHPHEEFLLMPVLRSCLTLVLLTLLSQSAVAEESRTPLFNGKTLDGWVQKGGKASFVARNGAIVGHSVPRTPNSFLCTEKRYGDFVLEYEYKCDNALNSGVQIRSNVFDKPTVVEFDGKTKKIAAGRVHGYQVEIDPNKPDRMWSGGIYDEGRRGWLYPGLRGGDAKAFTEQGQKIYKPLEWNSIRVECRGNRIRTWLNGELRADFEDAATSEGFIALQVHGVGGNVKPLFVRWRNLKITELK
jgi:hypothetical protein